MTDRKRLLTFLAAIPLMAVGSRITLPGVNAAALKDFIASSRGGLLGLYELVFQGGLHRAAILGLGIMPYLTARVYMRLWRAVNPKAATTRFKTRVLTVALSLIQSAGLATFLQRVPGAVAQPGPGFIASTMLTLTAGSLVAMWFGEQLTAGEKMDELGALDDDLALRELGAGENFANAHEISAARPDPDATSLTARHSSHNPASSRRSDRSVRRSTACCLGCSRPRACVYSRMGERWRPTSLVAA